MTGRTAAIATCDDGSGVTDENPRTWHVDSPPPASQQYLFEK